MRFKQVSELITQLIKARSALASAYTQAANQQQGAREQMLLQYLAKRESAQVDSLTSYLEDAPRGVLDTWFENQHDTEFFASLAAQEFAPNADSDALLAIALELDNQLMATIAQASVAAPTPESHEALISLLQHEQDLHRRMVTNVARLQDI